MNDRRKENRVKKRKAMRRMLTVIAVLLVCVLTVEVCVIIQKRKMDKAASTNAEMDSDEVFDEVSGEYIEPHLVFWTDTADLNWDAATDISMHVAFPTEWKDELEESVLKIQDGKNTLASFMLSDLQPESDRDIGKETYCSYQGMFSVTDKGEEDSYTAVSVCAKWGEHTSDSLLLYRDIPVTDEMMYTCCEILDEITELVENMGDKTEDGIAFSEKNSPEDVLHEVLAYLEKSDKVFWASLETDSMIRFTTIDGVSSFYSLTRVYEDEGQNLCGSGIPSDFTAISKSFRYDRKFRSTAVNGNVLVSCPVSNSYTDRMGSDSKSVGKKLAEYLNGDFKHISGFDGICGGLISMHNRSWTEYGTVMQITHSSAIPRGDDTNYILYTMSSSYSEDRSRDAYERLLDSWARDGLNETEGDRLQNCFREISHDALDNRSNVRLAFGVNTTYIISDETFDWHILPVHRYEIDASSDYLMWIYQGMRFENTIFYFGSCESFQDSTLNRFLYDHGAASVIGYQNPVNTTLEQWLCKALFETLMTDNEDLVLIYRTYNLEEADEEGHDLVMDALAGATSLLGGAEDVTISDTPGFVYHGEGTLTGTVRNQKGKELENAVVIAYRYFNSVLTEEDRTTTNAKGSYKFNNLNWGMYLFHVYYKNEGEVVKNFSFGEMIHEGLDFTIPTKKHLTGTVKEAKTGKAVAGAQVIVDDKKEQTMLVTDEHGMFEGNFYPGTYTIVASKNGYKDSEPYSLAIKEDDEDVVILDDILLEPGVDYYRYIRDNLLPKMGYASLEKASKYITSNTWMQSLSWDQRFGLAGADIVDLNNDGVDDLLVYYMKEDTQQTYSYEQTGRYPMSFYVDLYTMEDNQIVQVSSGCLSGGNQTSYEYLRLGLMKIDGRTYLYVESLGEAYFADGFGVSYMWYEYGDSGAFLPRWNVCKSDGGSSDIAFSLYTCTSGLDKPGETENYSKTIICADSEFLAYEGQGVEPLMPYADTHTKIMLRGFEEMGNIPKTSAYGGAIYSDPMPTYWTEEYMRPSVSYTCEGTGTYRERNITVTMEDLTQLKKHIEELPE